MIDVTCRGCGAEFTTDDEFAGQKTKCPECGNPLAIPGGEEEAPREQEGLRLEDEAQFRREEARRRETAPAPPPQSAEDEAPAPEPIEEPSEEEAVAVGATRSRMVKCFTAALAVLTALALLEVLAVAVSGVQSRPPATVGQMLQGVQRHAEIVANYQPEAAEAPALGGVAGDMHGFTLALLVLAMLALGLRLLLRVKLLDALASSPDGGERGLSGVTVFFFGHLALVGLLAWAASTTKIPAASDSVVGGILAAWLLVGALLALANRFAAGRAAPHLTGRVLNDGVFGLVIAAFLAFGGAVSVPMSRFGVVALALLLNSALGFTLSSRFVLENERVGRFGRRLVFLVLSVALILALGYVGMALESHAAAVLAET